MPTIKMNENIEIANYIADHLKKFRKKKVQINWMNNILLFTIKLKLVN